MVEPMLGRHISTSGISARDAFSYWMDVICETFIHLDCASPITRGFSGGLYTQPFGQLQLSAMASDEIDLTRSTSRIAAAREEHCLIVVQGRGRTTAEQDGRQFTLETGDLALFDSARPYFARLEHGFHHFVLKLPRDELRRRLGPLETVTATRISGKRGMGRLASMFIRELPNELDLLDDESAQRVASTCIDLVAAALASQMLNSRLGASSTRVTQLFRAKAYIAANVQSERLSPPVVAGALGITPRYLADLFAEEGTSVARHIWMLRLERCKAALCDLAQLHRSISEIAYAWGFNDMSHFSRFFREHVGLSPREFREQAQLKPSPHNVGSLGDASSSVGTTKALKELKRPLPASE
jgi:AraC-like DNA-binding protein